jgi:hypothetical protein
VLRTFKKKYGQPCDVVAKDKCFYFAHSEDKDDEGEKETKSHFDFGLFGNLNGSEYSDEDGKKFAFAYYREELKAKDCNPDIFAQQNENKDNPHKTKHVDECMKALGNVGSNVYSKMIIQVWQKNLMTHIILMLLELLIVDQEQ